MDLKSLQDAASNLTLYDLKAGVRKVQNAVMNYTEMEAKVREATNNEPWGASSSMMQEIANGTFNYQQLNEIMPMIYKRFTEKSAEEWRQIYKALQLMEFLIKNGSERVIDDARSHLSLLKMLRQFHYIDQNGKDQGINVRNRSKELTELLSDVDRIRTERKKARQTKNKYGGVEGGAGMGFSSSSGRYGGFGSESAGYGGGSATFGGSSRAVYGDGGGFGGEASTEEYDEGPGRTRADKFDEYDEYDDGGAQARPARRKGDVAAKRAAPKKAAAPPKPKEPEVDLFDFGDEPATTITAPSNGAASSAAVLAPPSSQPAQPTDDDDDFDDFQSATPAAPSAPAKTVPSIPAPNYSSFSTAAPTTTTQYAQPTPQSSGQNAAFSNILSTASPPPGSASTPLGSIASPKPTGYQPSGPNYFQSVQVASQSTGGSFSSQVKSPGAGQIGAKPAAKSGGGDAFASLLGGAGLKSKGPAQKGPTIADMAKQKTQAGLYGANAPAAAAPATSAQPKPSTGSSGLDDLLG
ncbi:uncharacterized protein RHO25_009058 [Cercospora beticola]|uniref:ENTH domain-containing protein n=1 Tax=Cercospora beticola TaxID=122368 RepID=A0ABZ0NY71_CERBT|nr:hypothetical protein RHO25_009058 [Cercospora beticola]CAK1356758.1 unnamed protein product [Cercospora beticola]